MAVLFLLFLAGSNASCPSICFGSPCDNPCYISCGISCTDTCSPSCLLSMLNDSMCQDSCNTPACSFDMGDCRSRRSLTLISLANTTLLQEASIVSPYNYGKVAGVGLGVFLTVMALIAGVLLCVIGTATPVFFIFLLLGILVPLITFLIVGLAPLHKDQAVQTDTRTDTYITARILFLITMVVFALIGTFKVFEYYLGINIRAKGVNSNINSTNTNALAPVAEGDPNGLIPPHPQSPGLESQNPLVAGRNPVLDPQNPLIAGRNPAAESLNPLIAGRNPVFDPQNPLIAGRNLVHDPQNPLIAGRNPAAESLNPLIAGRNPVFDPQNPLIPGRNPMPGGQNPPPGTNPLAPLPK